MTMLGGFGGSKAVDEQVAALITGLKDDVEKVGWLVRFGFVYWAPRVVDLCSQRMCFFLRCLHVWDCACAGLIRIDKLTRTLHPLM